MLKTSYAGCLHLSPTILSQFALEMCAIAKKCKNFFTKTNLLGFKVVRVIDVDKSKKPVISACYDMQHGCAYLQQISCCTR